MNLGRSAVAMSLAGFAVVAGGCFSDFTGYAAAPTQCNPVALGTDSPAEFLSCRSGEACLFADATLSFDPAHTSCVAVRGDLPVGHACAASGECGRGKMCTNLGCTELCFAGDSCRDGERCLPSELAVAGRSVGYCPTAACAPLAPDSCADGCTIFSEGIAACRNGAGPGRRGSACSADTDCARDFACDTTQGRCTTYCRLGQSDCPKGKACLADGAVVGGIAYGTCAL